MFFIYFTVIYFPAVEIPVVVPGRLLRRWLLGVLGRQRGAAEAGGGNPPTISPSALQRRYNPDQGITVNGESGILSEDNRQSVQIQFIVQCALAQCSVCLYDDEKGFLLSWT